MAPQIGQAFVPQVAPPMAQVVMGHAIPSGIALHQQGTTQLAPIVFQGTHAGPADLPPAYTASAPSADY